MKKLSELMLHDELPTCKGLCAVYFLFHKRELVYIGKSSNLKARLAGHNVIFDLYSYIQCEKLRLNDIEKSYIKEYKPNGNKTHTGIKDKNRPSIAKKNSMKITKTYSFTEKALKFATETSISQGRTVGNYLNFLLEELSDLKESENESEKTNA